VAQPIVRNINEVKLLFTEDYMAAHKLQVSIFLEDTDAQGIVYHANYLKYLERARSRILKARGLESGQATSQPMFVVHEMKIKFKRPARLGDELEVTTEFEKASEYRLAFEQQIRSMDQDELLVSAQVQVVCVDKEGNLVELPENL
jgi:tol-pal system-associated acyl-CoA thioesterase